jgi:hypothetical protein
MKMIGIGKLDLTVQIVKIGGRYAALDRGARANVHKDRRFDIAVHSMESAASGVSLGFQKCKHKQISFFT